VERLDTAALSVGIPKEFSTEHLASIQSKVGTAPGTAAFSQLGFGLIEITESIQAQTLSPTSARDGGKKK
jgi:hypothetical protein